MDEREASTVVMTKNTGRSGLAVEKLRQILSEDSSIWRCSICFTCLDVCPRDAEFTEFMIALRNLAALQGIVPTVYREQGSAILETGLAFKIPESRLKMRERYGLPPLPRVDAEPVRRLLESVGFDKLVQRGEKK